MSTTLAAVGLDAGSTATKLVGVDARGEIVWTHLEPSAPRVESQAEALLARARAEAGRGDVRVVATGYGRKLVPGASRVVTEITCHARGVHRALGRAGTLVDIGGQDSKVMRLGPQGQVLHFVMNDKCAAGTGRFLEVTAGRLQLALSEMGPTALAGSGEVPISSTCTVFAESEIVSLLARGAPVEHVVRGLHRALVGRVVSLIRSLGPRPPYFLSGGVARNEAVRSFLAEALGAPVECPREPQFMGAYGAALAGLDA
jgi:predicted CoA-substrate-specific enzyme activase